MHDIHQSGDFRLDESGNESDLLAERARRRHDLCRNAAGVAGRATGGELLGPIAGFPGDVAAKSFLRRPGHQHTIAAGMRGLALIVLSMAALARAQDPSEVLTSVREKLLRSIHSIPRYTCIETINREYFYQLKPRTLSMTEAPAASCNQLVPQTVDQLPLVATDRLRLEVAVIDGAEVFSWPGASKFERYVGDVVQGPFGTGAFGTYLMSIFDNPGAHFAYVGERTADGHRRFEYAFHVPKKASGFRVTKNRVVTGYGGSFQVDPANCDLVRMTIETDELPPGTGMCRSTTKISYHRVRIGDGDFVLPLESQLRMSEPDRGETNNRTTFFGLPRI